MVVWIIGLSGAGKTTLSNEIASELAKQKKHVILIDGDVVREVFGNDLGHSIEDRRKNADRVCRLCKFLDDQGMDVVCAILSLFEEHREWNRRTFENYFEIYIESPLDALVRRDPKGLYKRFAQGDITDVAGMDIDFEIPVNAHLVIDNSHSRAALLEHAKTIADKILAESI